MRIPPIRIQAVDPANPTLPNKLLELVERAIIYESEHILILDKPAGLAVHSGSGVAFGVIDLVRKLRPQLDIELVHRLDRDTSGCLVLAKHRQALLTMQRSLQDNSLKKNYIAVVKGNWQPQKCEISKALKKVHLPNGERRVYVDAAGKSALSRIELIQSGPIYSVVEVEILTGRTHQIRVHCQSEGHEIAGDKKYGDVDFNRVMRRQKIRRLMLHASRLELPASEFTPEIVINAALPAAFEQLLAR